jgi:predicted thioredoxin/glutaredoxin
MLIRKPAPPPSAPDSSTQEDRLENLLSAFEANLQREIFFIRNKETQNLLELLPQQGDLIQAIVAIVERISLPEPRATALRRRLAAADALREANRAEADRVTEEMHRELEEMSLARQRIRQVRHISKTLYTEKPASRLQDFA